MTSSSPHALLRRLGGRDPQQAFVAWRAWVRREDRRLLAWFQRYARPPTDRARRLDALVALRPVAAGLFNAVTAVDLVRDIWPDAEARRAAAWLTRRERALSRRGPLRATWERWETAQGGLANSALGVLVRGALGEADRLPVDTDPSEPAGGVLVWRDEVALTGAAWRARRRQWGGVRRTENEALRVPIGDLPAVLPHVVDGGVRAALGERAARLKRAPVMAMMQRREALRAWARQQGHAQATDSLLAFDRLLPHQAEAAAAHLGACLDLVVPAFLQALARVGGRRGSKGAVRGDPAPMLDRIGGPLLRNTRIEVAGPRLSAWLVTRMTGCAAVSRRSPGGWMTLWRQPGDPTERRLTTWALQRGARSEPTAALGAEFPWCEVDGSGRQRAVVVVPMGHAGEAMTWSGMLTLAHETGHAVHALDTAAIAPLRPVLFDVDTQEIPALAAEWAFLDQADLCAWVAVVTGTALGGGQAEVLGSVLRLQRVWDALCTGLSGWAELRWLGSETAWDPLLREAMARWPISGRMSMDSLLRNHLDRTPDRLDIYLTALLAGRAQMGRRPGWAAWRRQRAGWTDLHRATWARTMATRAGHADVAGWLRRGARLLARDLSE